MKKSRKLTLALAFALVLTVSAAYAALNGTITITGTADLRSDLWVVFCTEDPDQYGFQTDETGWDSSFGEINFTPTVATVTVNLEAPGSAIIFGLISLRNVGTLDAILVDAGPIDAPPELILSGGILELDNIPLEADGGHGALSNDLIVQWDPAAADAAGSTVTFEIPINFIADQ